MWTPRSARRLVWLSENSERITETGRELKICPLTEIWVIFDNLIRSTFFLTSSPVLPSTCLAENFVFLVNILFVRHFFGNLDFFSNTCSGRLATPEGRCLAFLNDLQHKVKYVQYVGPEDEGKEEEEEEEPPSHTWDSKYWHERERKREQKKKDKLEALIARGAPDAVRKILCFFVVDPDHRCVWKRKRREGKGREGKGREEKEGRRGREGKGNATERTRAYRFAELFQRRRSLPNNGTWSDLPLKQPSSRSPNPFRLLSPWISCNTYWITPSGASRRTRPSNTDSG
jgi:hypothetical protein